MPLLLAGGVGCAAGVAGVRALVVLPEFAAGAGAGLAAGAGADDARGAVAAGVRALEVLPLLPAAAGAVPELLVAAGVLPVAGVASAAAFDLRAWLAVGVASAEAGAAVDPGAASGADAESAAAAFLDLRFEGVLAAGLSGIGRAPRRER